MCHNSSTCHAYVMWAELGHSHFLYVLAVSNVVTTGNGHLKWSRVLGFVFSIQSSVLLLYCSESKPILYLTACQSFISLVNLGCLNPFTGDFTVTASDINGLYIFFFSR